MSLDEKQKFTAVICITSSCTFAYVGWQTVGKKWSPADNKLKIYTDSEIIFVQRTFFNKRSLIIVGTDSWKLGRIFNPYPTAFPYGNGTLLHFYQQQESSTTKTVHKVINKGLKAYV
jgi:hypothetical protein